MRSDLKLGVLYTTKKREQTLSVSLSLSPGMVYVGIFMPVLQRDITTFLHVDVKCLDGASSPKIEAFLFLDLMDWILRYNLAPSLLISFIFFSFPLLFLGGGAGPDS